MKNSVKFSKRVVSLICIFAMFCIMCPCVFASGMPEIDNITYKGVSLTGYDNIETAPKISWDAPVEIAVSNVEDINSVTFFSYKCDTDVELSNDNVQFISQKDGGDSVKIVFTPRASVGTGDFVAKIGGTDISKPAIFYYKVVHPNPLTLSGSETIAAGFDSTLSFTVTADNFYPEKISAVKIGDNVLVSSDYSFEDNSLVISSSALNLLTALGEYNVTLVSDFYACTSNAKITVIDGINVTYSIGADSKIVSYPVEKSNGFAKINLVPDGAVPYFIGWTPANDVTIYKSASLDSPYPTPIVLDYYNPDSFEKQTAPSVNKEGQYGYIDCRESAPNITLTAVLDSDRSNDYVSAAKAQYVIRSNNREFLRFVALVGSDAFSGKLYKEAGFVLSRNATNPTKEAFKQYSVHTNANAIYKPGAQAYTQMWKSTGGSEGKVVGVNDLKGDFAFDSAKAIIYAEVDVTEDNSRKSATIYATPYVVDLGGNIHYGETKAASYDECFNAK